MIDKRYQTPQVMSEIIRYVNNRGTQRSVKVALRRAGATEEEIAKINWNKNYFTQREIDGEAR